jgi:hypothetical protein
MKNPHLSEFAEKFDPGLIGCPIRGSLSAQNMGCALISSGFNQK